MNRFRDNYEAPGLLRTIAQWMNDVGRFLNGINVVGNGHIEENARGSVTITVGRAGGGGNSTEATFGFQIVAVPKLNESVSPAAPYDPPHFEVKVYPGSAQVMGGMEMVFPMLEAEVVEGEYIWIRYRLWDSSMSPVQAWQEGIQHGLEPPFDEVAAPKSMVFVLGQVSGSYPDNVVQFRLGSFIAVATIALSPDGIDAV